VELTNVHRQVEAADREMLAAERTGQAADALANLAERGRVHIAATPEQADGEVIETYKRLRDQGRAVTDLFVNTDTSNDRVDTYNRLIQNDRLRRGEIGGAHLDYRSTNAGRHETLYVGDRIALVTGIEDRGQRVANGRKGTIARIDEEHRRAMVRLDDGHMVRIDVAVSAPMVPIRLCYAGHACRLQGAEAPVVLVVPGNATTSLESAYSALSRGQEEIHVFADTTTHGPDPLAHLARRWAHPEPKRTATARAREQAEHIISGTGPDPYADLRPGGGEASRGQGPMTRRQQAYLASLSAEAGEEMPQGLTRAAASHAIAELQRRSGRDVPEWAAQLAGELAALDTIAQAERSPAPPAPHRVAAAPPVPERVEGPSEPMTHRQRSYLRHLAAIAGEDRFQGPAEQWPQLTRAEATERITELERRLGDAEAERERAVVDKLRRTDRPVEPPPRRSRPLIELERGLGLERRLDPPGYGPTSPTPDHRPWWPRAFHRRSAAHHPRAREVADVVAVCQ
jgi:hypothetical protein